MTNALPHTTDFLKQHLTPRTPLAAISHGPIGETIPSSGEEKMTKPKTIVLWGQDDLIGTVLEHMLSNSPETAMVRVTDGCDLDRFLAMVDQSNPEVVLINRDDRAYDPHLPLLLIHDRPEIKVITISLESNFIEVFDHRRLCVQVKSDLLDAIEI